MIRFNKFFGLFLPVVMLISLLTGTAQAALLDFGPIVPEVVGSTSPNIGHGFPAWFRDTNRVPLQMCLEEVPGCLFAAADRPNPAQPARFPDNLPDELFYYSATATMTTSGGDALLFAGVEMNFFNNGPNDYEQVGFSRVRIRFDTTVAGDYTVTTPWKQYFFTVDQATIDANAGRRVVNATEDIGLRADGDFAGVLLGNIGPYVYSQGAPIVTATGAFLGTGAPLPVQGSTFTDPVTGQPANIFRIEGPPGFATVSTNQFAITGKIHPDPIATPLTVDKLTYTRDAAGVQVNAFATTQALSNNRDTTALFPLNFALTGVPSALQVSGAGLPTQGMTTNNPADGKFFSTSGTFAFQGTLPAEATVTNTADTPATPITAPLVDQVAVNTADYNPLTNTLSIAAVSYDSVDNPALQAFIGGTDVLLGTLANGQLDVTFPVTIGQGQGSVTYNIPPLNVTVRSAKLGSATAPVITFAPVISPLTIAPTPISPIGNNITATPTFTFTAIPGAIAYAISLWDNSLATNVTTSYTPAEVNCASGIGNCTVTQVTPLIGGHSYSWFVLAQNGAGIGPWSVSTTFDVLGLPVAPAPISPMGSGVNATPTYTFSAIPGAIAYAISLWDNTLGTNVTTSYTPAQANCSSGTGICTVPQTSPLISGHNYSWLVLAQNGAGIGPWSATTTFDVLGLPSAPTPVIPTGSGISATPTYTFSAIPGAIAYAISLWDNTLATNVTTSYTPAQANCSSGIGICTVPQATPLIGTHSYSWFVLAQNAAGIGPWSASTTFDVQ